MLCMPVAMTNRNESEEEEEEDREEERGERKEEGGGRKRIHGIIEINLKYENDDTTDTTTRRHDDGPPAHDEAKYVSVKEEEKLLLRDGKELRWGEKREYEGTKEWDLHRAKGDHHRRPTWKQTYNLQRS